MKYPEDFINKIICGDCLGVMKEMPDKCVDLILTDPPYHLVSPNSITFVGGKTMSVKKRWGHWEVDSFIAYEKLIKEVIQECKRILKWDKCLIMWLRAEYCGYFARFAETIGFKLFSTLCWVKNNPVPHIRKTNYRSSFELAMVVCNGEKSIPFNFISQAKMKNYFNAPIGDKETIHPTEKPSGIFQWHTQIHTQENDLVLDPFIGSGTTAKACKLLKRNFVGIEINPEYCKIAEERLAQGVL